jgi:hypothetical protein
MNISKIWNALPLLLGRRRAYPEFVSGGLGDEGMSEEKERIHEFAL